MTDRLRRSICLILAFVLTANPLLAAAGGMAEDPSAPKGKKPGLTAAPNGVPLVNIARPDGRGLSHNMFDTFNVGKAGAILNNSRKAGRSQLGGVIANNPNLGSGPEARVILNEVTGCSRSRLEGYTEIFGRAADYILANPNGITINGGGFINTPKVTLTTGSPGFDQTGALRTLDVRRGDVRIDGDGLNAANLDSFDIVSRSAEINAALHAKNLGISTGYGAHDLATGEFSPLESDGPGKPDVAIDSSTLGGIYAERIKLVGNEKGVGVNLDGVIRATDQLVLTADGRICIKGAASSANRLSTSSTAGDIDISGTLAAGGTADVKAAGKLRLAADAGATAPLLYATDLNIAAGALDNGGRVVAEANLKTAVNADIANSGTISSGSGAALDVGTVRNSGEILAGRELLITAQDVVENRGKIHSAGTTSIRSDSVANSGDILSVGPVKVHPAHKITNTGSIATECAAAISAGALENSGHITSGQGMTVDLTGDMENSGTLHSGADVGIQTENLLNSKDGVIQGLGGITINTRADLENRGMVNAAEGVEIQAAGALSNSGGSILAQSGVGLATLTGLENSGLIQSGGGGTFRSSGELLNSGGIVSVGDSSFAVSGLLTNTGNLHSGAGSVFELDGDLRNDGQILAHGDLGLSLDGLMDNFGLIASDASATLGVGGILFNALGGEILAFGAADLDVDGDLLNSGRIESNAPGSFDVGGMLVNDADGRILSGDRLGFGVSGSVKNAGILHSGGSLDLTADSLDNDGRILAQGDSAITLVGDLVNRNLFFAGGESTFSLGGVLRNIRGNILSLKDMLLRGLGVESPMAELLNESGTIETLEGGMAIRAKVVRNTNLDFVLTPGTEILSRNGGYSPERQVRRTWWVAGLGKELQILGIEADRWERPTIFQSELEAAVADAEISFALYGGSPEDIEAISNLKCRLLYGDFYATLPGASEVVGKRDAMIISSAELLTLGLGLDRTVFMRSELDAAIAATEARIARTGGNTDEIAVVSSFKRRMAALGTYLAIHHNKYNSDAEAAYIESVTKDEVAGLEGGATIAAAMDIDIEADSFRNSVSRVSTAIGDINVAASEFENIGHVINEHHTVQWSLGRVFPTAPIILFPRNVTFEGNGVEVVKTPVGSAYGTISAGGKVFISADHLNNGISENAGGTSGGGRDVRYEGGVGSRTAVVAPPRPEDLLQSIADIDDFIGNLPKDGLFSVNRDPGHRYLIETNPALTSLARFYGSDYFLSQTGIDLGKSRQRLLGDAFYETRLVRDQIFALTGRRLLSSAFTSDAEQMLALMDNALAAREDLGLSIGVALTGEQIAALATDIVWLVTRVVDGREVLVPVVYLCRNSLDTIARGGSVIIGNDVDIRTTGDTTNSGVIKAAGNLAINAGNIFNTFGTIQGDSVTLSASDSILNTSGLIKGHDVSLDAGQDIISTTAKTTFSTQGTTRNFTRFTSETVGQRGSIEASDDLSMQAGRDIKIVGSDIKAGNDAALAAGRNVVITSQNLEMHSSMKTGRSKGNFNTQTSKAATVEAGGSVNVSAGQDVAVLGSHVSAGEDVSMQAGRDVSIKSATQGYDYYFKKKSKGGLLGGSSSKMRTGETTTNAESTITAGNLVSIEAGHDGAGDVAIVGSRVGSGGDMDIKARDGILVSSAQESKAVASASSESKLFSGKSKASGDAHVFQVSSEVTAGNDIHAEAKNIAVSASRVHAENDLVLKSTESDVIVSGAQNTLSAYRYEKKYGWNLNALLEIPLGISIGDGVEFYSSKMKEAKDTASFNFGSLISAGNNVEVDSARDAVVIGSTVAAGNDVNINAVRDTNLIPGLTAQTSERRAEEKSIGISRLSFSENEISVFAGVTKKKTGSKFTGDYNAGSIVSAGNDVKIEAGNNVNQFSSGIEAGRDVTLKSGSDINVDANKDIEHMEQYARQIQIGVTASARQSVTTAARTLVETPKNMASGEGSDAAKGITAASSILRGVSAAQQLTNVGATASITAGASVSQSSSSMDAAEAVSSSIRAGRDAELVAERDVKIAGAAVQAEDDVSIQAGRDVEIKSATNDFSAGSNSFSASAGVGLGASYSVKGGAAAGIRVQGEAAGSKTTSRAQIHANSAVAAGETLSVKSGADTTVAGANLEGKKVAMDVGGDLVVKSEQDKRAAAGSNWNAGGSATLGYGYSADAHVGLGKSKADSAWVNKQTSIIGQEKVDIRTEKNTHVEGAVIAAENGNLKLDTGSLTYRDIEDHDKSKNFQVSLSGSYSTSGGDQKDANGSSSSASGTLDAGYSSGDRRQINRATIGDGEIIIRLDPSKGLEGLNRDLEKAREITRDDAVKVQVYVDSDAVSELIDLIEKALDDPKTDDEAVKLLAELVSKGVITKKEADAILFKRSFTKAELKVGEEDLSRMVNMNDPHQLAAYINSLSPQERAAVAAVSMEHGRSQQEYELGLMALVGGITYLKVLNVNSPSEYLKLKINAEDLMPLWAFEKEQALVDSAANSYAANNNLEADMATYRNAQSNAERIQALNGIASDLGKAWGIDNVTVKIVPPNEKLGNVIAYAQNTLENGLFSSKFRTDYVICIPKNSVILNEIMVTGDIVHVFTHEITHMRQISIMNDQISGQKSDLGYLLVANNQMYINPIEVYGLYSSQPLESHANAVSDKFLKISIDNGVSK